jgi:integration host factor subunit alpha
VSALSKAKITEALCREIGLTKMDAKNLVEEFFEEIRHALETGDHVMLSRFGKFTLRDKSERPGRNPKTGKTTPVKARRVVTFKAGFKLKTEVSSVDL